MRAAPHTCRQRAPACAESMRRKLVFFLRHGQATHNVRAEALREQGCSHEAFLAAMAQDDEFDAALTPAGISQAREAGATTAAARVAAAVELVVASSLSRAIDTADLVLPRVSAPGARRVVREEWREIAGWLTNAKRRRRAELADKYGGDFGNGGDGCAARWDVSALPTEHDALWTEELERTAACAERAYCGLRWLWRDVPESRIAVAAHGGLFAYMMDHPCVQADARMRPRFRNCELRGCVVTAAEGGGGGGDGGGGDDRPVFRLEFLDVDRLDVDLGL